MRLIDADEILKGKVSNAYISRFELENAPTIEIKGRLIDTGEIVGVQMYDDENEDWIFREMTVEDYLGMCDNEVPPVDMQEVKHAHWIIRPFGWNECSNCHKEYGIYGGHYCMNCGAKMDEKEN